MRIRFITLPLLLVIVLLCQADAARRIYHWPYTSAQYNVYPNGDIDHKRAFYWGRVLGSDGLALSTRGLLPHLIEGNWQELVYNNPTEQTFIFDKVKAFQDLYATQGCSDNFIQYHTHPPLYGEGVTQWRADVIAAMVQKAELADYSGVKRILLDLEFASQDIVSTDPQFWYDLGVDIMMAMIAETTNFEIGFYPGLYGYWLTFSPAEQVNPRSTGTFPGQSSIPEAKRNMRHALLEGIYSALGPIQIWHFTGYTYSTQHLCILEEGAIYVHDLQGIITGIKTSHAAFLGSDIDYMFTKWDISRTQPSPVSGYWKQPNIDLTVQARNYDVIYQHSEMASVWDHGGAWDEDGPHYLTVAGIGDFTQPLLGVGMASGYQLDTVTTNVHEVKVDAGEPIGEKMAFFNVYAGASDFHIQGKLPDNFADYVDTMIVAAEKEDIPIDLADEDEFNWATSYKNQGFFQNHEVVFTPSDPLRYGYLRPLSQQGPCDGFVVTDFNLDCATNVIDFALFGLHWMQCTDPANGACDPFWNP